MSIGRSGKDKPLCQLCAGGLQSIVMPERVSEIEKAVRKLESGLKKISSIHESFRITSSIRPALQRIISSESFPCSYASRISASSF